MMSLAEIETELVSIRTRARAFSTVDTVLLCNGMAATAIEATELRASLARFEFLVRSANRMSPRG